MKRRVLYLGSGNAALPKSGMDVVARENIAELAQGEEFDLVGAFVVPSNYAKGDEGKNFRFGSVRGFYADPIIDGKWLRQYNKVKHVLRGKLLINWAFTSTDARKFIKEELSKNPEVVILDHILTLANVSLLRLFFSRSKIVIVNHDLTPAWIIDFVKFKSSISEKLFLSVEAVQAWLMEVMLIVKADKAVFLSDYDMRHYGWIPKNNRVSLCPIIAARAQGQSGHDSERAVPGVRDVVFVGSPGFAPNEFALDWLIRKLAPQLARKTADVRIVLVGRGTEKLLEGAESNVKAAGFISERDLTDLLENALYVISPVTVGGGIKIKLLEAFAAGSPVLATKESLRGFGFMGIEPLLDLEKPEQAADTIVSLAKDFEAEKSIRRHIADAWARHVAGREGALRAIVSALACDSVEDVGAVPPQVRQR